MRQSATTLASEVSPRELERLVSLLHAERLSGRHLEIGTAAGGTLKELMRCYPDGQRPPFVVVDPMTYFPDQLSIVRRNLASAGLDPDEVDFRISKSWAAFLAAERADESYSFIFIDGSHKINHVTEDLAWSRLLAPGGLICFHDYKPAFKGVVVAVNRFLKHYPSYQIIGHVDSLLVLRKTGLSKTREISLWDRVRANFINLCHQLVTGGRKRLGKKVRLKR